MPLWMIAVEWLARLILLGLLGLSSWSIAIIIDRKRYFAKLSYDEFYKQLEQEAQKFTADKAPQGVALLYFQKKQEMEKGLAVLGSLGSTTPFIGLLGTIMGIIVAFGELSQGKADTNAIMFALAEALVLTAVGLAVAIPAVLAFNHYSKKTRNFFQQTASGLDHHLASREQGR